MMAMLFGWVGRDHGRVAVDDRLAIEWQTGHGSRLRAGGDENLGGVVRLLFSIFIGDFHLARSG